MPNISFKPVINFWAGRSGYKPEAFVIHIAEGTLEGGYAWFNNPSSQVSAHYMVGKDGRIWQFVKLEDTAWHAGGVDNPNWSLLKAGVNPNLYTIGIEHEGFTGQPWTNAMYNASAELIGTIGREWGIKVDRDHIIGHYQLNSVNRSNCPGSGVDMNKLVSMAQHYYKPSSNSEIQRLQNEIKVKNQEITNLQSLVKQKEIQVNTLRKDLDTKSQLTEKLNKQIQIDKEKMALVLKQLNDAQLKFSEQEKQLNNSKEAIKLKDVQISALQKRSLQLEKEVKRLQDAEKKLINEIHKSKN